MSIDITFFGTNEFAATILKTLAQSQDFEIKTVVTMPDRKAGRKQKLVKSPVKILAEQLRLKILQPESLINPTPYTLPLTPLYIIFGYGALIPQEILDIPPQGAINIHPSLLPKYRGATPVQNALINGEAVTGITIMLMDKKMDHGPILAQKTVPIEPGETFLELDTRLAPLAAELLLETAKKWVNGKIEAKEQDHAAATFCKPFERDDGKVDFNKTAQEVYNQYRGLSPWPGLWTIWRGKRLKLIKIDRAHKEIAPGVVKTIENEMFIGTNLGSIKILEIQLEGKKPTLAKDFLKGNIVEGAQL